AVRETEDCTTIEGIYERRTVVVPVPPPGDARAAAQLDLSLFVFVYSAGYIGPVSLELRPPAELGGQVRCEFALEETASVAKTSLRLTIAVQRTVMHLFDLLLNAR